jgi:hypothetical protein
MRQTTSPVSRCAGHGNDTDAEGTSSTRSVTQRTARGQTEPLAALVAVAAVCVGISIYSGVLSGVIPELGADRNVGEATAQRVWHAISENGVYDPDEPLQETIDPGTLPQGYYVAVNVTYVDEDGRLESVAATTVDAHADPVGFEPPGDAKRYERALPIKHRPGDVRPGRLQVVVWS